MSIAIISYFYCKVITINFHLYITPSIPFILRMYIQLWFIMIVYCVGSKPQVDENVNLNCWKWNQKWGKGRRGRGVCLYVESKLMYRRGWHWTHRLLDRAGCQGRHPGARGPRPRSECLELQVIHLHVNVTAPVLEHIYCGGGWWYFACLLLLLLLLVAGSLTNN